MLLEPPRQRWYNRFVLRFTSSAVGAAVSARFMHHVDKAVYRWSNGQQTAGSLLSGLPVITLTTIGRKSKKRRQVPLLALPDGQRVILIASNWGQAKHPAWYHNLTTHPQVTVGYRGQSADYLARELHGSERETAWQQANHFYRGYGNYAKRVGDRVIPVIELTPADEADDS